MSVFAKAKKLEPKASPKKAATTDEVPVAGLEDLARTVAMIKNLEAVKGVLEAEVKSQMRDHFVTEGERTKRKPANFRGVEGIASASCQLRKRSSRSVLTEEEVERLEGAGLPYETVEDTPELLAFNPEALTPAVMKKIEKALSGVKGLPEDLIVIQEAKSRNVVSDETITEAFEKGVANSVLDIVATLSVTPKLEKTDVEGTLDFIKGMMEGEIVEEAKPAKKKAKA